MLRFDSLFLQSLFSKLFVEELMMARRTKKLRAKLVKSCAKVIQTKFRVVLIEDFERKFNEISGKFCVCMATQTEIRRLVFALFVGCTTHACQHAVLKYLGKSYRSLRLCLVALHLTFESRHLKKINTGFVKQTNKQTKKKKTKK